MITLDTAVAWLFPCYWLLQRMPFYPPEKRAQGFDVVRYRRRCGERLGCFGGYPATPGLGGAGERCLGASLFRLPSERVVGKGWLGSSGFCAALLGGSYCWLLRFGLPTVPVVGKGWLGSSSFCTALHGDSYCLAASRYLRWLPNSTYCPKYPVCTAIPLPLSHCKTPPSAGRTGQRNPIWLCGVVPRSEARRRPGASGRGGVGRKGRGFYCPATGADGSLTVGRTCIQRQGMPGHFRPALAARAST